MASDLTNKMDDVLDTVYHVDCKDVCRILISICDGVALISNLEKLQVCKEQRVHFPQDFIGEGREVRKALWPKSSTTKGPANVSLL